MAVDPCGAEPLVDGPDFIRWSRLGGWERLPALAQERKGVELGMAYLDGTNIRAQAKAAWARKRGLRRGTGPS